MTASDSSQSESLILPNLSDSDIASDFESNVGDDELLAPLFDDVNLKNSDYVLVKFNQKPQDVFYVGIIQKTMSQNDFDISFMRKASANRFTFPLIEDVSMVTREDITALLPPPMELPGTSRTRAHFCFKANFGYYNMR